MTITHNGKTISVPTIKELYEKACLVGKENAILAINIEENTLRHIDEYCEQVEYDDIRLISKFRPFGWDVEEHEYPAFEIELHDI